MQQSKASSVKPGTIATSALVARVRSLVERIGVGRASLALGISRPTLLTIAAGLPVRAGSIALAELNLRGAEEPAPRPVRRGIRAETFGGSPKI
jgi:hypothetical protein